MSIQYNIKGTTFNSGDQVTNTSLNNLVDSSTWSTTAITAQPAVVPSSSTTMLLVDGGGNFGKCTSDQVGSALTGLAYSQLTSIAGSALLANITGASGAASGTLIASLGATQAQMEAPTNLERFVTPAVVHFHPASPKAWVNLTGGGTPVASTSFNFTSVTDNGVGDWTISWGITFSSVGHMAQATVCGSTNFVVARVATKTTNQTRVLMVNASNSASDPDIGLDLAVWGDLP